MTAQRFLAIRGASTLFITALLLAGCFGSEGQVRGEGTVSGLEGQGLELALDDGQRLELVPGTERFAFSKPLEQGRQYRVSIASQPTNPGQACWVINENGTFTGGKERVGVTCTEDVEFQLRSRSDIMQMYLEWDGPDTVNVLYSSDPDCDWDNYRSCENSAMLVGQSGGSLTLGAVDDGFDPDTGWYFVAQIGNERTNQVGARPAPPAFSRKNPNNAAILPTQERLFVAAERPMIYTGAGVIFDAETGEPAGNSMPVIDGGVSAAAPDGEGGWYIGGGFDSVGRLPRQNLARIRADGSTDPEWEHEHPFGWAPEDVSVRNLVVAEDILYVVFRVPHHRSFLKAFRADTGELVDNWPPGISGDVLTIDADETHLYVGGSFSSVDGESRSNLAAFTLAGTGAENTLDLDWQAGVALDAECHMGYLCPRVDPVSSIAVSDGVVYASGTFNLAGQGSDPDAYESRSFLAAFESANRGDGSGQLISQWTPSATNASGNIRLIEDTVHAGGIFEAVDAGDGTGKEITDWEAETSINWGNLVGGGSRSIGVIARSDTEVFVGGSIQGPVIDTQQHLIALDRRTGTLIPDWPALELEAYDAYRDIYSDLTYISELAIAGDRLYAGGRFSAVNGEDRWRLAAVDRHTGALDEDWNPGVQLPLWRNDGSHHTAVYRIHAMVATDAAVYVAPLVGGNVHNSTYPQEPPQYLVALEAAGQGDGSGTPITSWNPEVDAAVRTLLLDDDVLYAGGDFEWSGQTRRHALAAFSAVGTSDGTEPLIPDWHPDISRPGYVVEIVVGEVHTLYKSGDTLYVAGEFERRGGGLPRDNIAAFDAVAVGDGTGTLDPDWDPGISRSPIEAVSAVGDKVYVPGAGRYHPEIMSIIDAVDAGDGTGQVEDEVLPRMTVTKGQASRDNLLYISTSTEFEEGKVRQGLTVIDTETWELAW